MNMNPDGRSTSREEALPLARRMLAYCAMAPAFQARSMPCGSVAISFPSPRRSSSAVGPRLRRPAARRGTRSRAGHRLPARRQRCAEPCGARRRREYADERPPELRCSPTATGRRFASRAARPASTSGCIPTSPASASSTRTGARDRPRLGLTNATRSHFGAQDLIDRGIANPEELGHASPAAGWRAGAPATRRWPAAGLRRDRRRARGTCHSQHDLRGRPARRHEPSRRRASRCGAGASDRRRARPSSSRRGARGGIALIDGPLRRPAGKVCPTSQPASRLRRHGDRPRPGSRRPGHHMDVGIRRLRRRCRRLGHARGPTPAVGQPGGQLSRALGAFHGGLHVGTTARAGRHDRVRPALPLQPEQRHRSRPCRPDAPLGAGPRGRTDPWDMAGLVLRQFDKASTSRSRRTAAASGRN